MGRAKFSAYLRYQFRWKPGHKTIPDISSPNQLAALWTAQRGLTQFNNTLTIKPNEPLVCHSLWLSFDFPETTVQASQGYNPRN